MKFLLITFAALFSFSSFGLINGKKVNNGDFSSVVSISGCTATKIGPRHFVTAGHCTSGQSKENITFRAKAANMQNEVEIRAKADLYVHPTWTEYRNNCRHCSGGNSREELKFPTYSDIAIYVLKNEESEIPWIEPSFEKISKNVKITLVGFGCTNGVEINGDGNFDSNNARFGESLVGTYADLKHTGSHLKASAEQKAKSNIISNAYQANRSFAALCPGDSGGPLLTKNPNGDWVFLGVAGDYSFKGQYEDFNNGSPMTSLHTRIDKESFNKVDLWIKKYLNP